jgi:hypothetical protein
LAAWRINPGRSIGIDLRSCYHTPPPRREAKLIYSPDELLKLLHDTKALSVWNRNKGPVFWYIAGVPGPFYINTELMIGKDLAQKILEAIDAALEGAKTGDYAGCAARLNRAVLDNYQAGPVYQKIVATMVARAREEFADGNYSFISGGERRDWLFSIPFAKACGLEHLFLFKNGAVYSERAIETFTVGLHVCDLINNAASHFEMWFPALEKAKLKCIGTLCVNSRGESGVKKLSAHGQKTVSLNHIDLDFFKQSLANGLIDQPTYAEIACHFASPREWAARYLIDHVELFDVKNIDRKSFERLQSFFARDPWDLRKDYEGFFAVMQKQIAARLKSHAT